MGSGWNDSLTTAACHRAENMTVTLRGRAGVRIHTLTDYQSTDSEFELGTVFRRPYGNSRMGGIMVNNCTRPSSATIVCRSKEPVEGWVFLSVMTFYPGGMINNRTLVTQSISTVKYYQRDGAEQSI